MPARSRALAGVIVAIATGCTVLSSAQTSRATQDAMLPRFEVAAIRRNTHEVDGSIGAQPNGRFVVRSVPLRFIIQVVYEVPAFRVTGGPPWLDTDRWDIEAKAEDAVPEPQLHLMMRTLLAERFNLVLRHETRPVTGFALVRARANGPLGPQLRAHPEPCAPKPVGESASFSFDAMPVCGGMSGTNRLVRMTARPLADLAAFLSRRVSRPVADRTGLLGLFDASLEWTADSQSSAPLATGPSAPDDSVSVFTALQEQLGLRLENERVDTEFLVVERVDRSTEN